MNHSKSLLQRITFSALLIGLLMFFVSSSVFAEGAKNIIVMISDGCGYNQIDATSIYQYGKTGTQVYERFPVKYAMATFSAGDFDNSGNWKYRGSYDPAQAWTWFEYVKNGYTDSASAGTAMSTGIKTYDAGIGVDVNKKPLKHYMQLAKELGKATGVITSVQFSHATPATHIAHNVSRNNYAEIAREMILDSKADLIMGCGHPLFDNNAQPTMEIDYKYVGGQAVWEGLLTGLTDFDLDGDGVNDNSLEDIDGDGKPDKWTLIQDVVEFQALMNGDTPKRVIGVPKVYQTLQYRRKTSLGEGYSSKNEKIPYETPLNQNVPTLVEMTKGALNFLHNNPKGFTLMIEGGAVDWACHDNSSARMIEEEIDFNKSVEAVIDWVNQNSNWNETLLIVTGDHECGYLTGPGSGPEPDDPNDDIKPVWNPLVNNGAGNLPGMEWHSGNHTNSLIPFFAKGAGASFFATKVAGVDSVRGSYIDNTEIAKVIFELHSMK
ncbi:TPA: alkaline phosphatase [bacterium]|nr:alkaline phosphatase [bacterium]